MNTSGGRLRMGIVGCGFFGSIQLEAWRRIPDVQIAAACDESIEKAQAAAPRAYTSAAEMLEKEFLDFVDIATRPESHFELLRLAIAHKTPAICQKPLARSMEEALAMADAVRQSGVRVMVHENWRWQPWYRQAKRVMQDGEIGRPIGYYFRTRQRDGLGPEPYKHQPYFREMPRLLVYETLIHHLDTARFLYGNILSLHARIRRINPAIRAEDRALLSVVHESGADGLVDGHRFLDTNPPGPAMGEALLEGDDGWIDIAGTGAVSVNGRLRYENAGVPGYRGDSVYATQEHFVSCLRSGCPFETGIEEYLGSFAAVEAAYVSAREAREVRVSELLKRRTAPAA